MQSVIVETDTPDVVSAGGDGEINVSLPDGSVVIDLASRREEKAASEFDANLAIDMDAGQLVQIAESLMEGIEADISSRAEWETTRARGIELLGLKIEAPRSDLGSSSAPLEGMATIRDSTLLEAVLRAQSNMDGELLPAEGPVKVKNVGEETSEADDLADELEEDMNHFLTDIATEYYPDTKRLFFWVPFGGSGFKKIYSCPIRRRPVSESVDANDLIVSNAATDLNNAIRVTHRVTMQPSVMKRMQHLEMYRDVELTQPTPVNNRVDDKKASVEGVRPNQMRPQDQPYTLYESCCELVLDDYAPKQFKGTEVPLPYRVTIDKDSRQILEVRRNWKEEDEAALRRKYFVRYPFIEGMGIYGIGFLHTLGNTTQGLTGAKREMLDAGMFANFPGFLILKSLSRQLTNEMRIPPGGSQAIDVPSGKISDGVMPLPYKDVSPGLLGLVEKLQEDAQRLGGTLDLQIGEGKQDAPVGTTLALLDQATKVESAIHKGLHHAQAEEFQLLKERFREDPEAFWRHDPKAASVWTKERFLKALDNCDLVPVADPNTPSHMHRLMKAVALLQLSEAAPQLYDQRKVHQRVLRMAKIDDSDDLFAPPQASQAPDPKFIEAHAKVLQAETAQQKLAFDAKNKEADIANDQAERQNRMDVETIKLAQSMVTHAGDTHLADRSHVLEQERLAHQKTIDLGGLAIEAHKALNPPKPAKPSGGKK